MSRHLVHVPLVHNSVEMSHKVDLSIDSTIQKYWDLIDQKINSLPIDFSKVLIYQDSLANLPEELISAWFDSNPKSPNFDMLRDLVRKGAKLIGTENYATLMEQYELINRVLNNQMSLKEYTNEANPINTARDKYIANRIDKTLTVNHLGILFIGARHNVQKYLPNDIEVTLIEEVNNELFRDILEGKEIHRSPEKE